MRLTMMIDAVDCHGREGCLQSAVAEHVALGFNSLTTEARRKQISVLQMIRLATSTQAPSHAKAHCIDVWSASSRKPLNHGETVSEVSCTHALSNRM